MECLPSPFGRGAGGEGFPTDGCRINIPPPSAHALSPTICGMDAGRGRCIDSRWQAAKLRVTKRVGCLKSRCNRPLRSLCDVPNRNKDSRPLNPPFLMGYHYVPKKYLKGFSDPLHLDFVWQFDKKAAKFSGQPVAIEKVAQQRGFYDPNIEKKLNDIIEIPGNRVLEKLRFDEEITKEDRAILSIYIATMITRVPQHRKRALELAPKALDKAVSRCKQQIRELAALGDIEDSIVAEHLTTIDNTEEKLREISPLEAVPELRIPWPSNRITRLIFSMTWRFIVADESSFFLTSDNPAFFFECYGLGKLESELTFPISSRLVLFGSWSPIRLRNQKIRNSQLVKLANRRIAYGASRFIFSRAKKPWIPKIASKNIEQLSIINW